MNNQKTLTFKHDPYCDCGICAFCEGQDNVYGQKTQNQQTIQDKEMLSNRDSDINSPLWLKITTYQPLPHGLTLKSLPNDIENGDLVFVSPSGKRRGISEMRILQRIWLKIDSKVRSFLNMPNI